MPGRIFGGLLSSSPSPPQQQQQQQQRSFDKPPSPPSSAKSFAAAVVAEVRQRPTMEHIKRPSLAGLGKKHASNEGKRGDKDKEKEKNRSTSKDKHSRERSGARAPPAQAQPVTLGLFMESPPVLFIGSPQQSTGALISGRLQVTPNAGEIILEDIVMFLEATTTTKRPVQDRCRDCTSSTTDLYEWKFLSKPKLFNADDGTHELPFSHLVPGHLPATTHGRIGTVDYSLHVRARASDGRRVELRRELPVRRALIPSADKNSVRIFPPTDLTLHVTLPNIVHPIGEFPVLCRMTGITTRRDDAHFRWRLRKLTWRVEEHETAVSPACAKHAAKLGPNPGTTNKGIQHSASRDIGLAELKAGWKTDFDGEGQVEGEFAAAIDASTGPQCTVDSPNGLKITHALVLELVIAEEWVPSTSSSSSSSSSRAQHRQSGTPTGAARVLRTQFALQLSDRAGMGISWDDEMPPVYEDVPASPPHYGRAAHTRIEDHDGSDLPTPPPVDDVPGLRL